MVNVATRQINSANALGVGDWERKNWPGDCCSIIDTGFNGGDLRSYPWLRRYVEYLMSFYHKAKLVKTREKELGFAFWNHQGRTSEASTVLPIWFNGSFRPVRVTLIHGKAELLLGMHIVKKLGAQVCSGSGRCKVGQVGRGMTTLNGKNHCVWNLAPTACAYAKSDEYFRKLRKAEIEGLKMQGDFGENVAVRKVAKTKIKDRWEK